ncbi:VirD4-like conjugal transfer protein, CD1115 family [Staphylococcus cohnii]|uniref:VirD4-like conjugal transfer protein, CD1115 family n=1 Tax=Staphylococcus cohnii TaxID=29382 RepID=UPI003D7C4A81
MPELFFSGRKLKKHWKISFSILVILALYITHIINIFLGVIFNKDVSPKLDFSKVNENLFSFKYVTVHMIDQFNLFTIFLIFAVVVFALSYLMQGILFEEKGYSEADEVGLHGTAKWGNPNELRNGEKFAKNKNSKFKTHKKNHEANIEVLKNNLEMESGYILGKVPKEKKLMIMSDDTDISNTNVLVVGPPGSAKSQSYVIPNILNVTDKSIIVTDPKGELKDLTSQAKIDQGYKVFQVDFVHFKEAKYNPLYYVHDELQAKKIANTMFTNIHESNDGNPFFKNSATNILTALIIYVKAEYDAHEANMRKVIDVYNEHVQDEEVFNEWIDTFNKDHPAYDYMIAIKDLTSETRKSVTATLNTCFDIFKLPEVQEMTSTSDFNFEDFIDEKSILYVKLSMNDDTFSPITSVFFSQMIDIYYDIANDPDSELSKNNALKRKVAFYLDEFANIGKIGKYAKTLSTCRSLGLSMHTIIQNKVQLEKKSMYGQDEAKEIISSHDSKLILRVDRTDTTTSEWISKSLGDTTISQEKNDMTKSKGNISKQIGNNYMKRPLMTPQEIASMQQNECLLLVNGCEPLKLEKAFQYEIYPDMLTTKTDNGFEYNYDNIRSDLGYTDPVIEDNHYEYKEKISFSNYRQLQKQKEAEAEATKQREAEQTEEKQQERQQEQSNEANDKFNKQYENSVDKDKIKEELNNMSEAERQESLDSLNEFNSGFTPESNKVNGVSFNELNEETQNSIVNKSTESVSVNLGLSEKLNDKEKENKEKKQKEQLF